MGLKRAAECAAKDRCKLEITAVTLHNEKNDPTYGKD